MCSLEVIGALRPQDLHHEEDYVSDVAFHELVHESWASNLRKHRVDLVCLGTHILKYVVYLARVQHYLFDWLNIFLSNLLIIIVDHF